ncbi:MAG: hypothetical protein J7578_13780 [Chitinophagaceae bacterium]|nr:hypothetical protein [Chitinophagaceae bacterium]
MKKKNTIYLKEQQLIITELSGDLDMEDVEQWSQSLKDVLSSLEPNTRFKILVDLHGFKAQNFEVHKKFRVVVPLTLAAYGWYIGYLRMFPETEICISSTNNIHCIAAAHVHQDETKIRNYAENYSMINEGYFTDPVAAREWIEAIPLV